MKAANVPFLTSRAFQRRMRKKGFWRSWNESINSNDETDGESEQPPSQSHREKKKEEKKRSAVPKMGLSLSFRVVKHKRASSRRAGMQRFSDGPARKASLGPGLVQDSHPLQRMERQAAAGLWAAESGGACLATERHTS